MEEESLECEVCGNTTDFEERTITKWHVNSDGERIEKISEILLYSCSRCGQHIGD